MEIMVLILFLSPPPQDLSQANVSHSLHVQSTISKEIGIVCVISNQRRSKNQQIIFDYLIPSSDSSVVKASETVLASNSSESEASTSGSGIDSGSGSDISIASVEFVESTIVEMIENNMKHFIEKYVQNNRERHNDSAYRIVHKILCICNERNCYTCNCIHEHILYKTEKCLHKL